MKSRIEDNFLNIWIKTTHQLSFALNKSYFNKKLKQNSEIHEEFGNLKFKTIKIKLHDPELNHVKLEYITIMQKL